MLIAGGDSFTWGHELPDCDMTRPSKLTWSSLLSNRLGLEYNCVAEPGAGNKTIARKVMQAIDRNPSVKHVAVMWSFPIRYDISLRNDIAETIKKRMSKHYQIHGSDMDKGWTTLSVYNSFSLEDRISHLPIDLQNDKWYMAKLKDMFDCEKDTGITSLSELFLGMTSREHHMHDTLLNIFALQSYLKERGIDYTFCSCNDELLNYMKLKHPLVKSIDLSHWLDTIQGFTEWVRDKGYPVSGMGHPGPEAHAHWLSDKYNR